MALGLSLLHSISIVNESHVQFAVGGTIALLMWTFKLHERPKVSADTVTLLSLPMP